MSKRLAAGSFLVGSLILVLLLSNTVLVDYLELKSYDLMMYLRGPGTPPQDILIVAIDNASRSQLAELGFPYPWPRGIHGELINLLNQLGARMVVFDVLFDLPTGNLEQDQALADAIAASSIPVVLGANLERVDDPRFTTTTESYPLEIYLEAGAEYGFVNLFTDPDGLIRRAPLEINGEPGLSPRTYQLLEGSMDDVETGPDGQVLIKYVGGGRRIPTVSYVQALDYENSLPQGIFRDKIVMVGRSESIHELTGAGQADIFLSPFDLFGEGAGIPGVEIHANLLNQLLRKTFIRQAPGWWMLIITVLLAAAIAAVLLFVRSLRAQVLLSLTLMLGYVLLCWIDFTFFDYWLLPVQPTMAAALTLVSTTFYEYRRSEKERAQIRQALKGYVSGPVMSQILSNPGGLELGGETVTATVLFSDIAKFSKIAEKTTPKELAALLNEYFTRAGDAIMSRQGMINKYIGDAVMALWGVPLQTKDHAALACDAALEMKEIAREMPEFQTRIGINTGPMVAGNLGHLERMEYTVIGDEVNLASRLEGANKAYGTSVMISESTQQLVSERFVVRLIDWIRVIGKERPVRVYELIARAEDELPQRTRDMLDSFEHILETCQARDWKTALELCRHHLESFPEDSVVALAYLPRCEHFLQDPPGEDWDGVYELKTK